MQDNGRARGKSNTVLIAIRLQLTPKCDIYSSVKTNSLDFTTGLRMSVSLADFSRPAADRWDSWGAWLSLGCVVHCLAGPLVLLLVPMQLASWIWAPAIHFVVAVATIGLMLAAVIPGYREHGRPAIPFLATLGSGLILLGSLWPCGVECSLREINDLTQIPALELFVASWTPLGAGLLASMHVLNRRLRRWA